MKKSPDVERWFADRKYVQEPVMRRLRDIILMADPRVSEYLKYGTVIFGYEGDMVSFVGMNKKPFTLMFNRGARIPGRFPHLEGTHPSARFMRFKDVSEVDARAGELTRVVAGWCELVTPTTRSTRPGAGTATDGTKTRKVRARTSPMSARPTRASKKTS